MIISVASGKGGTGKTTVAVNLALSLDDVVFADCDVEEPNAHIFLKPRIDKQQKAFIPVPKIDESLCDFCARCAQFCVYNAIAVLPARGIEKGAVLVFEHLCHGCGACSALCPQKAIKEINRQIGIIESGSCGRIEFIHGKLDIGEAMSPPLIRQVKAGIDPAKTVIIDAPPGTSCPVVTSVKGSDFCILVTEPTPFGLNDLILAVEMLKKIGIPFAAVINRSDLGDGRVEEYCRRQNIAVLMRLPFKKEIAVAYSKGESIVEVMPEYKKEFRNIYEAIKNIKSSEGVRGGCR